MRRHPKVKPKPFDSVEKVGLMLPEWIQYTGKVRLKRPQRLGPLLYDSSSRKANLVKNLRFPDGLKTPSKGRLKLLFKLTIFFRPTVPH